RHVHSTRLPYTTLFRSGRARSPAAKAMPLGWLSDFAVDVSPGCPRRHRVEPPGMLDLGGHRRRGVWRRCLVWDVAGGVVSTTSRSEEHTSELQSRVDLV